LQAGDKRRLAASLTTQFFTATEMASWKCSSSRRPSGSPELAKVEHVVQLDQDRQHVVGGLRRLLS
jgi:hypothetical protein